MQKFKLDNGVIVNQVFLDSSHLREPYLDGIMVSVYFNDKNELIAQFQNKDLPYLKDFNKEDFLNKVIEFSQVCFQKNQLSFFSGESWKNCLIDIVDNQNNTYLLGKKIHFKEYMNIKVEPFLIWSQVYR